MGRIRPRRGVLGVLCLAAITAFPAVASAATARVTVGTFVKGIATDMDAYYPTRTSIRAGDSVRFTFAVPFHTVTFTGRRPMPAPIIPTRTTNPETPDAAGQPFWWSGRTPVLGGNPRALLPFGGRTVSRPNQFVGSGLPERPGTTFTVKFPKPGTYEYGCALHPRMRGKITVLPRRAAASRPADIRALAAAELAADRRAATALVRRNRARPANTRTITVGPGANRFSVTSFFPRRAIVPAGSTVTFRLVGRNEVHTITFGGPPVWEQLGMRFIQPPPPFSFGSDSVYPTDPPAAGPPAVTATAHGNGLVGSGIVSDPGIPGPRTFRVRFPERGTFNYLCFFHEDMTGQIVVR